jgi:Dolichyl-phosphate-mannose-protein mannosyltransferase
MASGASGDREASQSTSQATLTRTDRERLVPARMPVQRFPWGLACLSVVIVAGSVGLAIRMWYLTHSTIDSDASVAGLMARDILHGHFQAFYWGQPYGGVEPYLIAMLSAVIGQSAWSLCLTPVILTAGTALVTWRIGRRLVSESLLAALAGALVWIAPAVGVRQSTIEYGFRSATMFFGALSLLLSLRILDGRRRLIDCGAFGLVVGVTWWSSPESVFFLLPSSAILAGAMFSSWREDGWRAWVGRTAVIVSSFLLGALPWIWSNLFDGFASLHQSLGSQQTSYLQHVGTFFQRELPIQLGLNRIGGAAVISGDFGTAVQVLAEILVVALIILCALRPGRTRLIALATLGFPFLYAASPLSFFWQDGRYAVYFPVLLALTTIVGFEEMGRILTRRRGIHGYQVRGRTCALCCMLLTLGAAFGLSSFSFFGSPFPGGSFFWGWRNPNDPTLANINLLVHDGIRVGYANYWVAYRLDFLSDGRLTFSPVPGDVVRNQALYETVRSSPSPAWLFVPKAQLNLATGQFGTSDLQPDFEPENQFLYMLRIDRISYRTLSAGMLNIVIPRSPVPST